MIGRFAPSPTGPLHIGSLITAVASYLQVKSQGGSWLVRIEDIDAPRQMPGADQLILDTLGSHGLHWDGEVVYQSQRHAYYQQALQSLQQQNLLYACRCSRKEISDSLNAQQGLEGVIYPGTCREQHLSFDQHAIRVRVTDQPISYSDLIQGSMTQTLSEDIGDFVLRRADGIFAYQLAVVVDDAMQGVTHVLRGCDLLDSTPRQIYLQQCLALPTPEYAHIPVISNRAGEKLSKQTLAPALQSQDALENVFLALQYLGQQPPQSLLQGSLTTLWQWALEHWDMRQVPHLRKLAWQQEASASA
jgi:glutamyl-Q tRNA(Asp) synthetase